MGFLNVGSTYYCTNLGVLIGFQMSRNKLLALFWCSASLLDCTIAWALCLDTLGLEIRARSVICFLALESCVAWFHTIGIIERLVCKRTVKEFPVFSSSWYQAKRKLDKQDSFLLVWSHYKQEAVHGTARQPSNMKLIWHRKEASRLRDCTVTVHFCRELFIRHLIRF